MRSWRSKNRQKNVVLYLSFKEEYFKIEEMVKVNLSEDIKYEQWKNDIFMSVDFIAQKVILS